MGSFKHSPISSFPPTLLNFLEQVSFWTLLYPSAKDEEMLYRNVVKLTEHSLEALRPRNVERGHKLFMEDRQKISYSLSVFLTFTLLPIFCSGLGCTGSHVYL